MFAESGRTLALQRFRSWHHPVHSAAEPDSAIPGQFQVSLGPRPSLPCEEDRVYPSVSSTNNSHSADCDIKSHLHPHWQGSVSISVFNHKIRLSPKTGNDDRVLHSSRKSLHIYASYRNVCAYVLMHTGLHLESISFLEGNYIKTFWSWGVTLW